MVGSGNSVASAMVGMDVPTTSSVVDNCGANKPLKNSGEVVFNVGGNRGAASAGRKDAVALGNEEASDVVTLGNAKTSVVVALGKVETPGVVALENAETPAVDAGDREG